MSVYTKKSDVATEIAGPSVSKAVGICTTCVHSKSCAVHMRTSSPIWYCEEFDEHTKVEEPQVQQAAKSAAYDIWSGKLLNEREARQGICVNCENHGHCTLESLEGPMFCEEYR